MSATLRSLLQHLEESDVIVYLIFDDAPAPRAAGHVSFISVAGGRRYLRIAIIAGIWGVSASDSWDTSCGTPPKSLTPHP